MARPRLNPEDEYEPQAGSYFTSEKENIEFVPTGCTLLDCVLGGGYVLGRITNIIGNNSTGKTLLAMEGAANFLRKYPNGKVFYRETEAAFDIQYASALGIPIDRIDVNTDCVTVEDMFEDLTECCEFCKENNVPGMYITDSLDALSDRDELKREIDKGSYGAAKAKLLSSLFRQRARILDQARMCWIIVSQVRDNIGVMFGSKDTRSGGRALDFYSTQILKLNQIKTLTKEKNKIERAIGIRVRARADKNKIALPKRECTFDILFAYGIDDEMSNIDWMIDVDLFSKAEGKEALKTLASLDDEARNSLNIAHAKTVRIKWREIEESFLPDRKKY